MNTIDSKTSNGSQNQLSRIRHRRADTSPKLFIGNQQQSLSSSGRQKQQQQQQQQPRERQERLQEERDEDKVLMVATIVVFLLVVAFSVIAYYVWTTTTTTQAHNSSTNRYQKAPQPSRRKSRNSRDADSIHVQDKEAMAHWQKELVALDDAILGDKISKSDILMNPDLLLFRNGTMNKKHWRGKDSSDVKSDTSFFKRSRLFDSFPWEQDEDISNLKIYKEDGAKDSYAGKPYLDYTTNPSLYQYPEFRSIDEHQQGYPQLSTLQEIFSKWPQHNIDHPPTPIRETLQHFDYTNADLLQGAWKYIDHQLPFKLTNVPELLAANTKWTDAHVAEQFQIRSAQGNCQESPTNFFAFYDRRKWKVSTMGLPPTRDNDFGFRRWAKHARFADQERLSSHRPHFYWQAGVSKEERYQPKDTRSFLGRDLPSFSATKANTTILCPDPAQSKGIQCRFGERGVTTANHFDGGQNMVGMITGAKRYILSPPNQCSKLGIHTERGTALYRHSLLNLERLLDFNHAASELEQEWLEQVKSAQAVETVLKAGEVLFIPSHWFHYIISLQKNAQCNVRFGIHVEGNNQFGGQYHVSAEGCR